MQSRFLYIVVIILAVVATWAITSKQHLKQGDTAAAGVSSSTKTGSMNTSEVEAIVENYIMENPETLYNALLSMQQKKQAEQAEKAKESISENMDDMTSNPLTPVLGNPDGDKVVIKFNDYLCTFCKRVAPEVQKLINNHPDVKVLVKELSFRGPQSAVNARASMAFYALFPEKYAEFHEQLLKRAPRSEAQLMEIAGNLGVDTDKLKEEMDKQKYKDEVQKMLRLSTTIGVRGTPAFIINEQMIPGAIGYAQMKQALEG